MRKLSLALLASAALSITMASEVWAAGPAPVKGIVKSSAVTSVVVRRGRAGAYRGRAVAGRRGFYRGGAVYARRGGVYVGGGYPTYYDDEGYTGGGIYYRRGVYARRGGVYAGRRGAIAGGRRYAARGRGIRRR
jgi:hypothetical protein